MSISTSRSWTPPRTDAAAARTARRPAPRPALPERPQSALTGWRLGFLALFVLAAPILGAAFVVSELGVFQAAEAPLVVPGPPAEASPPPLDAERIGAMVRELGQNARLTAVGTATAAPTTASANQPAAELEPERPETYTVVRGDTLSAIGRRLGVATLALAAYNDLEDPNRLRIGQLLSVPSEGYVPPPPEETPAETAPAESGPLDPIVVDPAALDAPEGAPQQ